MSKMFKCNKLTTIISIIIPTLLIDQITKFIIYKNMNLGESINILNFLNITFVKNYGAAFSFLNNAPIWFRKPFFLIVPITAIIIVSYLLKKENVSKLKIFAFSFIIAGAFGNFIDRLTYGFVVDFLDLYIGKHHWPVFNVADISITIAIVLLIILEIKTKKESK